MNASVLVGLLLLAACAPRAEQNDTTPSPAVAAGAGIRGVVRVVGSAPVNVQVVVQPAAGRPVRVTGPLRAELQKLAGAEVEVRGRVTASADPMVDREVEAAAYELVAVEGRPAIVGEVVEVTREWVRLRTPAGDDVYLSGAPADLRVGQKIWVQGPRSLTVQSYGILRP